MGFRPIEKFASITPVAASAKASADLPAAGTYYSIELHCLDAGAAVSVANITADILNVKITLDGTTVWEASAAAIYKLYEHHFAKHDGADPIPGVLPIILAPDYLTQTSEANIIAYGMANVGVMQLEVTFNSAITVDQIDVYVERQSGAAGNRPLGTHKRLLTLVRDFGSSGVQEITDLPIASGNGSIVTAAYHFLYDGSAAVINSIEVLANNATVMNLVPDISQQILEKKGRKFMVAGAANDLYSVCFDLSNDLTGYLNNKDLNDLRFKVDWSAAPGSYRLLRESYYGVGQNN